MDELAMMSSMLAWVECGYRRAIAAICLAIRSRSSGVCRRLSGALICRSCSFGRGRISGMA
jgi:hypothetical protein